MNVTRIEGVGDPSNQMMGTREKQLLKILVLES